VNRRGCERLKVVAGVEIVKALTQAGLLVAAL